MYTENNNGEYFTTRLHGNVVMKSVAFCLGSHHIKVKHEYQGQAGFCLDRKAFVYYYYFLLCMQNAETWINVVKRRRQLRL